jgi:hypothetical protein
MSVTFRSLAGSFILSLILTVIAASPSWAEPMAIVMIDPQIDTVGKSPFRGEQPRSITLIRVGPRVGLSGKSPFGRDQKEDFQQSDIAAVFGLPWGWQQRATGMKLDMRLLTSAGELSAAGDTGLMVTMVPLLALSSPNEAVSIDVGGGAAFFSNYQYGVQNFGGPAQIVGTAGIGFNLIPGFFAGYRFQHFSDAGTYGPTSLGVDMHMLEINYRF